MKWLDGIRMRLIFFGCIVAIVLGGIDFANGATITVGLDVGYDFSTIQAGIDAANDGDMVLVAPGEYVTTEPITFWGKAIMVMSEVGPDGTTIRMGTPADTNHGSVVIFENNATNASLLDGFTITGGSGSWLPSHNAYVGGGIYFNASSGTVKNCAMVQNSATYGGGVICAQLCSPILTNCTIKENTSGEFGGGIMIYSGSSMNLTNCIIRGNSAAQGGAGVCCSYDSSVTMNNCIIMANRATRDLGGAVNCGQNSSVNMVDCLVSDNSSEENGGGGIGCWYGSLTLTRCAIVSNRAGDWFGGGVYAGHSSATLTNCVIERNTAARGGGGLCSSYEEASIALSNCTICSNSGGDEGGGGGLLSRVGSTMVTNSIVFGNTSAKGREISVITGGKLDIAYSNVADGQAGINVEGNSTLNWGESNIDADPLFADAANGDYHLKSQSGRWDPNSHSWVYDDVTSPCIDAGDPMSPINLEPFPNGGFINMGAYASTPEASRTFFGEPKCETIIAGDINGDCQVNQADLEIMALHWTDEEPLLLP